MDDFGTGYSTMTMLKDQPVDEIKIDKGFIDDIDDPKSRTILKHTVTMLNELNLDTIVEGVENEKQKNFLLECGCTRAQGYLYYKPMPVQKFEELLELFIRRTRLATQPDIKTKFRGYLRKDFYAPKMSWATLIKGFVFLCTTKLDMTVKLTGKSGRVTTHSYTLILSEKSDYYEEIENGKGI
jgi:hypothetical protein